MGPRCSSAETQVCHRSYIIAARLGHARQWYLYEQIRQYCYSDSAKSITCPKPLVPKEEIDLIEETNQTVKAKGGREKALLN
jgi:hypothetical protein